MRNNLLPVNRQTPDTPFRGGTRGQGPGLTRSGQRDHGFAPLYVSEANLVALLNSTRLFNANAVPGSGDIMLVRAHVLVSGEGSHQCKIISVRHHDSSQMLSFSFRGRTLKRSRRFSKRTIVCPLASNLRKVQ